MNLKLSIRVCLVIIAVLAASIVITAQTPAKPAKIAFTTADREAITAYYKHEHGKLAPGSLDRKGFSPEVERALAPGNKVPAQLQRQMERLPAELDKKVSAKPAGYDSYLLGRDVLLVGSEMLIADVIKGAGWK